MNDFDESVARFREAMKQEGERGPNPGWTAILASESRLAQVRLRWALAVAALLALTAIPVWRGAEQRRAAAQDRADELLLEQVNAGLSRGVARAMIPLVDPVLRSNEGSKQ